MDFLFGLNLVLSAVCVTRDGLAERKESRRNWHYRVLFSTEDSGSVPCNVINTGVSLIRMGIEVNIY